MTFRVLALIPARSGSRGLVNKNIQCVAGQPLLVRAISLAQQCERRGEQWSIVVSTDAPHYADMARKAGAEVPFLRPKRLATAKSRLIDTVLHGIDRLQRLGETFDAVILISATTPLTTVRDVRCAVGLFRRGNGVSVVSVKRDPTPPSWRFQMSTGRLDRRPRQHQVHRRQETNDAHVVLNGALYLASVPWLLRYQQFVRLGKTLPLMMPASRSLDIESEVDLHNAEQLIMGGKRDKWAVEYLT